jgi:hypothetical protein
MELTTERKRLGSNADVELMIDLKTAKQIGLILPSNVLARADKVVK